MEERNALLYHVLCIYSQCSLFLFFFNTMALLTHVQLLITRVLFCGVPFTTLPFATLLDAGYYSYLNVVL